MVGDRPVHHTAAPSVDDARDVVVAAGVRADVEHGQRWLSIGPTQHGTYACRRLSDNCMLRQGGPARLGPEPSASTPATTSGTVRGMGASSKNTQIVLSRRGAQDPVRTGCRRT